MNITLSEENKITYNATDKPEFARGGMGQGKPNACRLYSVWKIVPANASNEEMAHCQSVNAWGKWYNEVFPTRTLEPWTKSK